jgi:hypothetical protein
MRKRLLKKPREENMVLKGVVLFLKDGKKDWYDPVAFPDGLKVTETHYIIDNGSYVYEIEKADVELVGWYEICQRCGRELESDGTCSRCEET